MNTEDDGRPCSMDEFVAALFEDRIDCFDLESACREWVYGDCDMALSYLSKERASKLKGK